MQDTEDTMQLFSDIITDDRKSAAPYSKNLGHDSTS